MYLICLHCVDLLFFALIASGVLADSKVTIP